MSKNKGGRKPLGENKREYVIKVTFNAKEREQVKIIAQSYNLNIDKRGITSPFLRRLILNNKVVRNKEFEHQKLPDSFSNLIFQINKIGTNINQLTKVANYKNMRSPNSNLEREIHTSNELLREILESLNDL